VIRIAYNVFAKFLSKFHASWFKFFDESFTRKFRQKVLNFKFSGTFHIKFSQKFRCRNTRAGSFAVLKNLCVKKNIAE